MTLGEAWSSICFHCESREQLQHFMLVSNWNAKASGVSGMESLTAILSNQRQSSRDFVLNSHYIALISTCLIINK